MHSGNRRPAGQNGQKTPGGDVGRVGRQVQGGDLASVALVGQPNVKEERLDNRIKIPGALSFLADGPFGSYVHGLDEYPHDVWPDNTNDPTERFIGFGDVTLS